MAMRSFTSNSSIPWAFCLAVVLVCCVELGIAQLPKAFWQAMLEASSVGKDDALRVRALLETLDPDKPVVALLGSSQVKRGISTKTFERALGGNHQVVNLGVASGGVMEALQILELVLEYDPSLVVVCTSPSQRFLSTMNVERLTHFSYSFSQSLNVPYRYGLAIEHDAWRSYFRSAILFNMFPSARIIRSYELPVRASYMLGLKEEQPQKYLYDRRYSVAEMMEQAKRMRERWPNPDTDAQNGAAIDLYAMLGESNAKVLIVEFPINPVMRDKLHEANDVLDYQRFLLTALSAENELDYFSRDEMPDFSANEFADVTHLNGLGRVKMTRFLTEIAIRALNEN